MSDQDPVDAVPTTSAIKTPLEDSPALRDPAAVGFVRPTEAMWAYLLLVLLPAWQKLRQRQKV